MASNDKMIKVQALGIMELSRQWVKTGVTGKDQNKSNDHNGSDDDGTRDDGDDEDDYHDHSDDEQQL